MLITGTERLSISDTAPLLDSTEFVKVEDSDIGTLISNVGQSIVEADNKEYQIVTVNDLLGSSDCNILCGKEVQRNRNIFCIRKNCDVVHRNGGAPPVKLLSSSILVMKSMEKLQAFITPIGSVDKIGVDVLLEWKSQSHTLGDWAHLFKLSEMAESGIVSKEDLEELSEFALKAAEHKTPRKLGKPVKLEKYEAIVSSKGALVETAGLTTSTLKVARAVNTNFEKVDDQFFKMEKTMKEILQRLKQIEEVASSGICSLEIEKEKLKLEVGSRSSVTLTEEIDGSSLWQVVSLLGLLQTSQTEATSLSFEASSKGSFETWASNRLNELSKAVALLPSYAAVQNEVDLVRKLVTKQNKFIVESQDTTSQKLTYLEKRIQILERSAAESNYHLLERRLSALEANVSTPAWEENSVSSGLESKVDILEKKVNEINPSKESTAVRFGHVYIKNLKDMKRFLQENIPSLHFGLPADYHVVMEHINQNVNPSKPTLDHLQNLHKLEIPTTNHSLAITALEFKVPKFFCKSKEYSVVKKNQSMFDKISSWSDWDRPVYGYKAKLLEELTYVRRTFAQMIEEDSKLTIEGAALVTNLLSTTVAFIQNFVRFIDEVYHELLASSFTDSAAWALATALGVSVSKDVAFPREGILNMLQMTNPTQCSTLIFHTCLKCHVVMKAYDDVKFAAHPNISSEYVKFLAHNAQFEVVARIEKRLLEVEDSVKSNKRGDASKEKQLNTTTQKVEECKSKLAAMETRLTRLEKK